LGRALQASQERLSERRIGRVAQRRNDRDQRQQLVQQFQPFRPDLDIQIGKRKWNKDPLCGTLD
jgi:hypothetical protein